MDSHLSLVAESSRAVLKEAVFLCVSEVSALDSSGGGYRFAHALIFASSPLGLAVLDKVV